MPVPVVNLIYVKQLCLPGAHFTKDLMTKITMHFNGDLSRMIFCKTGPWSSTDSSGTNQVSM